MTLGSFDRLTRWDTPDGVELVHPRDVLALLTGPPEIIAVTPVAGVGLAPAEQQ